MTKEEMIESLHLAAEEIILLSMAVNRQGIAQAHIGYYPQAHNLNVRIFPANTSFSSEEKTSAPLGEIDERLSFWEHQDEEDANRDYQERMTKIEQFTCYLDHLLALENRIATEETEKAA